MDARPIDNRTRCTHCTPLFLGVGNDGARNVRRGVGFEKGWEMGGVRVQCVHVMGGCAVVPRDRP